MREWRKYKLGDIITFQRGHDLPKAQMLTGAYPVAGSNGIIGYHNTFTTKGPGVTIGRSGNIGTPHFYLSDYWAHNTVLYIKEFREADPKFIFYFLRTIDFTQFNAGSAVPTLNRNHVHELDVRLPHLQEQQGIASTLSALDDKIDLLHRQNKTLEALAETLFRQWLSQKERTGYIGEYVKVQGGYAFKSKDFRDYGDAGIIKITNISMGAIDTTKTQFVSNDITNVLDDTRFKVREGDVLIAMTGAEIGKIGIVEETRKPLWVNQRVGRLIAKVSFGDLIGYLAYRSREGQEFINNTAAGSAQANISSSDLESMAFVSYSENQVHALGISLEPLFEKLTFNLSQIQTLTRLRDTLLPKLMSGEVRVKT